MAIEFVNWLEIPVADIGRARAFYESVFGFKMFDMDVGGEIYPCFPDREGNGFSGALVQYDFAVPGSQGPLVYLNAYSGVNAMAGRIAAAGGKIVKEPAEIAPGFGFYALFEDTEGNLLALQGEK